MHHPVSIHDLMEQWDQNAWSLAALSIALRSDNGPITTASREVMAAMGLPVEPEKLIDGVAVLPEHLGAQAAAPLLQVASLLQTDLTEWAAQPDAALLAQGRISAQVVSTFEQFAPAVLNGIVERLGEPGSRMLDVGTGVGGLAVAFAEAYPSLRVVGLDVAPRVLELAEENIAASEAADRVEIREQDVAMLDERDGYDLAWIPAPFVPEASLLPGIPAVAAALRPGGWLMLGHGRFGADPLHDALLRFRTIVYGGTALDDDEAEKLLTSCGLTDIRSLPAPSAAPSITAGRQPDAV
jgi:SAM-dependent methyltransferase